MAHVVSHLGLSSVFTVASNGVYGLAGITEFEKAAEEAGIAIAGRERCAFGCFFRQFLGIVG